MASNQRALEIHSDPKNITIVESFIEKVVADYAVSSEVYGNMLISLTEAVTNAIVHGNNADTHKKVHIKLEKKPSKIAFVVKDEGPGFDFDQLPDPTAPENIFKLGGRGVFLMKQLADLVVFSDNGSTVEIQFKV